MTELPGLPPFGAQPVFTPDDAAYDAVAGRAAHRRRRRLATATAATAVAVTVAGVGRPAAPDDAGLRPARPAPSATATAAPATPPAGRAIRPPRPAAPVPTRSAPAALPVPGGTAGPGGPPTFAQPAPPAPDGARRAVWTERVETVADGRPGDECQLGGVPDGWCFRYLGPGAARSGETVTFSAELCRLPGGRAADRVDLHHEVELDVRLSGDDHDGATAWTGGRERVRSRTVAPGSCLRWRQTWNGVGFRGRAVAPGTYDLTVLVLGRTPRAPLPGEADQSSYRGHGQWGSFEVLP